jgi:tRNA (guanine26-N2/guanine27-N2)-dimethyltransferase
MAGSGVRALRYEKEASHHVFANDINPLATRLISSNAEKNNVDIPVMNKDINLIDGKYDVVDVDPFGSPVRYLHSIMRLFKKNGYLFVTATDTAALCGSFKNACIRKYGALPLKTSYCHEVGLRILIGYIVRCAASWNYGVSPLMSFYKDHYMRVHTHMYRGKRRADESMKNMGYINHCFTCSRRTYSHAPVCQCSCGASFNHAAPVWLGGLCSAPMLESMLEEANDAYSGNMDAMVRFITMLHDEIDIPYYWDSHELASILGLPAPKLDDTISRIREAGHACSRTHFSPTGFKTDATLDELTSIFTD